MAQFLGYDANGTDGTDLSKMSAVYEHRGKIVRIPADTPAANIDAALAQAVDSNLTAEQIMRNAIEAIWSPLPIAVNVTQVNANIETCRQAIKALAMYLRARNES